jgi:glycosyltransferase involved in cell wall biosynthesis
MSTNRHSDLVCLSHLRWDFVFQRPQHLMTRHARRRRVFFVEEPVFDGGPAASLREDLGVRVLVPHLPPDLAPADAAREHRALVDSTLRSQGVRDPILWYYTPMALSWTGGLGSSLTVYDCMDELSAFRGAPPALLEEEARLLQRAHVVFTGGASLYEAKRGRHPNVHCLPSSVDVAHFRRARGPLAEPADQAAIPRPRLGFFGVLDERLDLELLAGVADLRPDWHWVMVGPVVKVDPAALPRRPNIHYLGAKRYEELPAYLAGWDVAVLPFARNEATRFISPTKTPEYLAAGRPVVSTSIRDVVQPYGEQGLVRIADRPEEFVAAAEAAMLIDAGDEGWRRRVDAALSRMSWNRTWARTERLIRDACRRLAPEAAAS